MEDIFHFATWADGLQDREQPGDEPVRGRAVRIDLHAGVLC